MKFEVNNLMNVVENNVETIPVKKGVNIITSGGGLGEGGGGGSGRVPPTQKGDKK